MLEQEENDLNIQARRDTITWAEETVKKLWWSKKLKTINQFNKNWSNMFSATT